MLIKQLHFSHSGLITIGNSCVRIFPISVLESVCWAKLCASPVPSSVQVACTVHSIMLALLFDCAGAQWARATEAAFLTSQMTRCIILKWLYPCPESSAPHKKTPKQCQMWWWSEISSSFAKRNKIFFPQLVFFIADKAKYYLASPLKWYRNGWANTIITSQIPRQFIWRGLMRKRDPLKTMFAFVNT